MSIFFNPTFYLQNNPDVLQAVARGVFPSAEAHFNEFGYSEGRAPNPFFDVSFYLTSNPDVLAAGVNPLAHFIEFGAAEGRAPSANFVSFADFDTEAYAAANPDLGEAGITTDAQLYAHFATFGFSENRPGVQTNEGVAIVDGIAGGLAGDTFTLTTASGENVVGTAGNDMFNVIVGTGATLNNFDVVNGAGGMDTMNILATGNLGTGIPASASVSGVEVINFNNSGTSGTINAARFEGAQQIWQIGEAENIAGVGAGTTVGLRSLELSGTNGNFGGASSFDRVDATFTAGSGSIALDNVSFEEGNPRTSWPNPYDAVDGQIRVNGTSTTDLETLTVGGTVDGDLMVINAGANTDVTTLNLNVTPLAGQTAASVLTVDGNVLDGVEVLDASGSTRSLSLDLSDSDVLEAVTTGSGRDSVTLELNNLEAEAVSVNLGAGNDTFTLDGSLGGDATAMQITLGAGNDTVVISNSLENIVDADEVAASLITITDFNVSEDVLDLSNLGGRDVLSAVELGNIAGAADLDAALSFAASATTVGNFSIFNFGEDAYVFSNNGDAGFGDNDGLIQLAGVQAAELDAGFNLFA